MYYPEQPGTWALCTLFLRTLWYFRRVTISYGLYNVSYYKPEYTFPSAVCVTRELPTWLWQFSHSPADMTYGRFCSVHLQLPIIVLCRRIMHGLRKHNYQVLCRFVFPGYGEATQYKHAGLPPSLLHYT
jgi:hypothetical protein